jgi:6-pyruvoyltetrahydropterin/6-carboxytetrahydropterin synthase
VETFKEFTFEAAHSSMPYEGLHGHSFKVRIVLRGEPHPDFGWSHNLYEVEKPLSEIRAKLNNRYLNEVEGLSFPTLENVTRWIWQQLDDKVDGLSQVTLSRGRDGDAEGCSYSGPARNQ